MWQSKVSFTYTLAGITDGVVVEEPFEINGPTGEVIATNELATRVFYLNKDKKLRSILMSLVVRLPDGKVFPLDRLDLMKKELGDKPTLEQEKGYFKKYFEGKRGKVVAFVFYATVDDIDKLFKKAADQGHPVNQDSDPYVYAKYQLGKKQIEGQGEFQKLVETGDTNLGIILLTRGTSDFCGKEPEFVKLP